MLIRDQTFKFSGKCVTWPLISLLTVQVNIHYLNDIEKELAIELLNQLIKEYMKEFPIKGTCDWTSLIARPLKFSGGQYSTTRKRVRQP